MADLGFVKSYIAAYDAISGTITLRFQGADFDQEVHIRDVGSDITSVGTLTPGETGWIFETEDEFEFIGNIQGENAVLVRIDNGPGEDPDYYVYSVSDLNLDPATYQIDNVITSYAYCLLEGTLIATIEGDKAVESLKRGDQVLTSSGDYKSVRWVGVQTVKRSIFTQEALPILIPKDSLGDNVPNRDLLVSADHAIFLDGFLIAAEALIDGNIRRVKEFQNSEIKYFGIDLGPATIHSVHNLPVGSLGAVDRKVFDNYKEWLDLDEELIDEPLMYPRVKHKFQILFNLGSSKDRLKSAN